MDGIRPLAVGDPARIGPYPLLGRLGAGGMGRVYLARSAGGRTVAVKVVHEEHIAYGEFRARFRREIESARRVGGRWTAPVLDADADAEQPWVATGYVPGPSLEQAVREHGPLPVESVHALAEGLLRALRGIHAAGIVHRDLKPSNVLLTADGPRVIDFGIARAFQVSVESLLTSTGMVIGSPGFMAPEQILGEETGPGADVFSLGCVLMYATAGQLPFGAGASNQHAVMFRIVQSPPDLSAVADDRLRALIERCLTKNAAERPGVDGLLAELAAAASASASHGAWLPPVLLARLARQSALLLDADVPGRAVAAGSADAPGRADVPDAPGGRNAPGRGADAPEAAEAPGAVGVSGAAESPGAADMPGAAEAPGAIGVPGAAEAPGPADVPEAAEAPGVIDKPGAGEPGHSTAEPAPEAEPPPAVPAAVPASPAAARDLGTVDLRPHPAEGPAPARVPAPAPAPTDPGRVAPPTGPGPSAPATGPGPVVPSTGGRSRRRRVWVVAAVVVAVLAAGGTTAFLNRDPGGSADARGGESTPPGAGDTSSGPSAAPSGDDEDGAKGDGERDPKDKDADKDKGSGDKDKGEDGDGEKDAGNRSAGPASEGGGSGGGGAQCGSGSSASGGSGGDGVKPPASNPDPAPDGRVPQHFVGTWSLESQYVVLQPHTVVIRRVSPGQSAVTLVADVQGSGHCEYTAKLSSVADGGKRINVGAGVVDRARSGPLCQDTEPSSFTVAGSGIQHDVGPAHGSGYRYNRG
ncbi:serine/threonine-protein kinase [Streptomyces californicus]|uniref:serine/threonine-protein kinase n=1 Tax=Streptomyces californicus TaxID=67351 RepID=UPI000517309E|nr:serine/threonine-protein kinase [Streptomyces californicus]